MLNWETFAHVDWNLKNAMYVEAIAEIQFHMKLRAIHLLFLRNTYEFLFKNLSKNVFPKQTSYFHEGRFQKRL